MGLLSEWPPHCRQLVAMFRSGLTTWYMYRETEMVTYPTKGFTIDVQAPRKALTEASNLSKHELCFNFFLSISI
jgi:hypothetical protein